MRSKMILGCVLALGVLAACGDDDSSKTGSDKGGQAGSSGSSAPHVRKDAGSGSDAATSSGDTDAATTNRELDAGEHPAGIDEGLTSEFMADAGDGWKSLIQAHWVVPANSEQYRCARLTVPEDTALHSFRALSPLGTHHTVLTVSKSSSMPDGLTVCDVGTNAQAMLSASGVGTNDFTLPDGVAIVAHKGEQLLLNLHLFNVSDKPIEGTSGALVKVMAQGDIVNEAESILAGTVSIDVPPHTKSVVATGSCTMTDDVTLVAAGAHAHMHATHVKISAHSSIDGDVVLSDRDYSFDSQLVYSLDPMVHLKKGDQVQIDCTYDNNSDQPISFGDSSLAEMCFAGLIRYPVLKNPRLPCVN